MGILFIFVVIIGLDIVMLFVSFNGNCVLVLGVFFWGIIIIWAVVIIFGMIVGGCLGIWIILSFYFFFNWWL